MPEIKRSSKKCPLQVVGALGLACLSLVIVQCSWKQQPKPSVLVLAVEYLGFDLVACGSDYFNSKDMEGFQVFCDESVRFTHAFSPSTMSQPALASILTGLYPFEHRVWHNGNQFLSSHFETAPEVAVKKGYRTTFISGGAPIWRKSGFSQGIEFFEDNVSVHINRFYRTARENFDHYLSWLDRDVQGAPHFGVIYISDFQYPNITTVNDLGEEREKSFQGQFKEVGSALSYLIKQLKRRKLWDNTYVILTGLNGQWQSSRHEETSAISLYSANTQVGLFIKPARKKRDQGIHWKIDKNVTLVDVGATLFDILEHPLTSSSLEFPVVSLKEVLDKPESTWKEDRLLLFESGWPEWRGYANSRFAIRKNQFVFIYDRSMKMFNSLTDRREVTPLVVADAFWKEMSGEFISILSQMGYSPWTTLPQGLVDKFKLGQNFWLYEGRRESEGYRALHQLSEDRPWDLQLWGWRAWLALNQKNWEILDELGVAASREIWSYVAKRNLGLHEVFRGGGCLLAFSSNLRDLDISAEDCSDTLFMQLLVWMQEEDSDLKLHLQERFLRSYIYYRIDQQIAKMNYVNNLFWDVNIEQPSEPSLTDLYLNLPKSRKYASIVRSRLSREYSRFNRGAAF